MRNGLPGDTVRVFSCLNLVWLVKALARLGVDYGLDPDRNGAGRALAAVDRWTERWSRACGYLGYLNVAVLTRLSAKGR